MLPDVLDKNLIVVFVGTSKSTASARAGHYYAHPQNMFWNLLEATGLTGGTRIGPPNDRTVLNHRIGLTDLVPARAASSDAQLRVGDYDLPGFIAQIEEYAPAIVAFNGERPATKVAQHLKHPKPVEGPAPWRIGTAFAYRLPSSSGAHATGGYAAKRAKWIEFGRWVREQRASAHYA